MAQRPSTLTMLIVMTRVILLLSATILITSISYGKSASEAWLEGWFNKEIVKAAAADVDKMEYPELSALSRYFAACEDRLSENDVIRHSCSVARALRSLPLKPSFAAAPSIWQTLALATLKHIEPGVWANCLR